ncbi:MAG: glycosyltransferase family 39 protein [Opitutales bacterium]|nr:glycosyltransferase family 39 protein [Opitutales bacterium]
MRVFYPISLVLAICFAWQVYFALEKRNRDIDTYYLAFDYTSDVEEWGDLFLPVNGGYSEEGRKRFQLPKTEGYIHRILIEIPEGGYDRFRIDPIQKGSAHIVFESPRIENARGEVVEHLQFDEILFRNDLKALRHDPNQVILSIENAQDPFFEFKTRELTLQRADREVPKSLPTLSFLGLFGLLMVLRRIAGIEKVSCLIGRLNRRLEGLSLRSLCLGAFSIVLVHRLLTFATYYPEIYAYMMENGQGEFLTWQYNTIDSYRSDFWKSLWYFQQNPPLPELIFGFCANIFPWPVGTHLAMVFIQFLNTALTTALVILILSHFTSAKYLWRGALLLIVLSLSISTVTMEYNWYGQTNYENLGILFLSLLFLSFLQYQKNKSLRYVFLMGLWVACLALTRSTFCYLFPLPLVFILIAGKFKKPIRTVSAYLVCILILQFGWSFKNKIVYDYFSISNSSWKGLICMTGLHIAGYGSEFYDHIFENSDEFEDWFVRMHREKGRVVFWGEIPQVEKFFPQEVLALDRHLSKEKGIHMQYSNNMVTKVLSDEYAKVYQSFVAAHPDIIVQKFVKGWEALWRPIKNYPHLFVAPFYTEPVIWNGLDLWQGFRKIGPAFHPNRVFINSAKNARFSGDEASLLTINYVPDLMRLVNVVNMTLLPFVLPIMLLLILTGRVKLEGTFLAYLLIVGVIYYLACSVSLVQFSRENCRYRIPIEPFIWMLLFIHIQWIYSKFRRPRIQTERGMV